MKRLQTTILTLVLFGLLAGTTWFAAKHFQKQAPEAPATQTPVSSKSPTSSGTAKPPEDWGEVSKLEMENLIVAVKESEYSLTLAPGESMLTDGREIRPGVFLFTETSASKVIPEGREEADAVVLVRSELQQIDISGGLEVISAPMMLLSPGQEGSIESGNDEWSYRLGYTATILPDGDIQLIGTDSFEEK